MEWKAQTALRCLLCQAICQALGVRGEEEGRRPYPQEASGPGRQLNIKQRDAKTTKVQTVIKAMKERARVVWELNLYPSATCGVLFPTESNYVTYKMAVGWGMRAVAKKHLPRWDSNHGVVWPAACSEHVPWDSTHENTPPPPLRLSLLLTYSGTCSRH